MPAPVSRARDSVLLATADDLATQFATPPEGPKLHAGLIKAYHKPDKLLAELAAARKGLGGDKVARAPIMGDRTTTQTAGAAKRTAVHAWLDSVQSKLQIVMTRDYPGSETYPTRFKFNAEDGLGTIAVAQLADEIHKDLVSLGSVHEDYGICPAFLAEGRALIDAALAGHDGTNAATSKQRGATDGVAYWRRELRKSITILREAYDDAQRTARGLLPPLDLKALRTAYADHHADDVPDDGEVDGGQAAKSA